MFVRSALLASLVGSSMATVYLTSPVSSTSCKGGESCTVSWIDNGDSPSLSEFGNSRVAIFVGSQNSQTMLQEIVADVNVETTSTISFTVDPNMGENSSQYFVRFDSAASNQAFSSKFTLSNMSGTFNSTVQAQIAAAEGSASSGATSTSSSAKTSSTKASSTSSSSAGASSAASGAERKGVVSGVVGVVALVAALSSYLL